MDAKRLADEIGIERADDDPWMAGVLRVEPEKVLAIQGHQRSVFLDRESEDGLVRDGLAGVARFLDGQNVVPPPSQLLDDWNREVLVGVEPGHRSGRLVLLN